MAIVVVLASVATAQGPAPAPTASDGYYCFLHSSPFPLLVRFAITALVMQCLMMISLVFGRNERGPRDRVRAHVRGACPHLPHPPAGRLLRLQPPLNATPAPPCPCGVMSVACSINSSSLIARFGNQD